MTEIVVRTQQELDAALKDPANHAIMIASEDDVTLDVSGTAGKNVGARSGILRVYGDAQVGRVYGDARIWDVSGAARIGDVYGDAQVGRVSGAAQVGDVYGDAQVRDVYGRARIRRVFDYAQVSLYGHARVEHPLGAHAVAYLHSPNAWASGAHVIDMTKVDLHDPEMWAAHTTADVLDGEVVIWKALGADLTSGEKFGRPVNWEVGQEVSCDDWNPTPECGGGLHLSPHPYEAIMYREEATRMLKCSATMSAIVPIIYNNDSDKCKVKAVRVIAETNMDGTPLLASEEK